MEEIMKDGAEVNGIPMGTASLADIVTGNVPAPTPEEVAEAEKAMNENEESLSEEDNEDVVEEESEDSAKEEPVKEDGPDEKKVATEKSKEPEPVYTGVDGAIRKLNLELGKAKDKDFAKPVIEYLIGRCNDSESLANDICQPHKTWEKCFKYIYEQARKAIKGSSGAVRDSVVYEWAEDYFHRDDKAEEEKKAKEKREREKKQKEEQKKRIEGMEKRKAAKNNAGKQTAAKDVKKEDVPKPKHEAPKPKPKKNEMEGQIDLFSMMGL